MIILKDGKYFIDFDDKQFMVGELKWGKIKDERVLIPDQKTINHISLTKGIAHAFNDVITYIILLEVFGYDHIRNKKNGKISSIRDIDLSEFCSQIQMATDDIAESLKEINNMNPFQKMGITINFNNNINVPNV